MSSQNKNRSAYIIGLILIGIGLLFLLNTMGVATFQVWYFLFKFWPVILILIGLNIILKKTALWWIVPILIFVIFVGAIVIFIAWILHIVAYFTIQPEEETEQPQEEAQSS